MMDNKEYARFYHVPEVLPTDFESFAAFTIELSNGEELWSVVPRRDDMTPTEFAKWQVKQVQEEKTVRLKMYAERVSAGLSVFEDDDDDDDDDDTEEDKWACFFASDSHPHRGGNCRKGVKNHSSFERFVDSAQ